MKDTLLLNVDHTPLGVVDWQRAVCLVMDDRVHLVLAYATLAVRSQSARLPWPAVISLRQYIPQASGGVPMTRNAIFARDRFTCQYCGRRAPVLHNRPLTHVLTVDHVVPRARAWRGQVVLPGGQRAPVHSWENTVTACKACNLGKGARSPQEAGMTLRSLPRRPSAADMVRITFARVPVEEEWRPYLPDDVGWNAETA